MKQKVTFALDLFYPPFKRIMPIQTFRYAACGGINTFLGLSVYFIGYEYLFARNNFDFGFFVFKPHNAALFLSFCFSFVLGFLLNRYIVFTGSDLKGRIQLFRYFLSFTFNLFLNYLLLRFFVEMRHWDALISQVFTTFLIVTFSYLSQKHFSFRVKKNVLK